MKLTVMTWNINGGFGLSSVSRMAYSNSENLSYFTAHIQACEPDIVCLQEVHVNASRSQAREIAARLGHAYLFETSASDSHIDSAYKLSNAVLAKLPFVHPRAVRLPRPAFKLHLPVLAGGKQAELHDKYMQIVQCGDFLLANVHLLPLHRLGSSYETREGMSLARRLEQVLLDCLQRPLILCGDFNTADLEAVYPRLFRELHLVDALPSEPSLPNVDTRIDYVLFSKGDFKVRRSSIAKTASDHFPCMVTFERL